jgi:hypothetical protein
MRKLFLLCLFFLLIFPIYAQEGGAWEVYLERDIDAAGTDRLLFINLLNGELTSAQVNGENFTPLSDYLLYFDTVNRAVMTVRPDGTVSPHPFITLGDARRVDWILSSDYRLIAWTLTYGEANSLSTVTSLAAPNGANQRLVLTDGPRSDGARVLPVAFSLDNTSLVLDSQPDSIGELVPYRQYAALSRFSLTDGSITTMQGEPGCFCAAALRAGQFVRLTLSNSRGGFDVQVYSSRSIEARTIASLGLSNYTQGGEILIAPDGNLAVYALSQVEFGVADPEVQSLLILIDLANYSQVQLSEPISSYIKPLSWTDDNSAILLSIPQRNGTWKINLADRELVQVAEATYLGLLEQ